ncbi:MAG TPA: YopT-type cysteine protease domain-containing protein [Aquabacterium sp.]|nr:YopT-type cysteine protease domain-containing protein [Aquabacterium sp.]
MGDKKKALALTGQALKPYCVANYSQDAAITKALGAGSDVKGGVCLALSMHWMRTHQNSRNTPRFGDVGLLNSQQVLVAARNIQLAYQGSKGRAGGQGEEASQQAGIAFACKLFGMSMVGALAKHAMSDDGLRSKLRQVHRYHVIAMTGFGIGHAIAAYMSSGKIFGLSRHVYIFDPNIGELKIPESELAYVLQALTGRYKLLGSNFTGCYLAEIKP